MTFGIGNLDLYDLSLQGDAREMESSVILARIGITIVSYPDQPIAVEDDPEIEVAWKRRHHINF